MNDLITVIIPIYKVEKYLNRCVESIVNQTYKKLEIILVDDGSPDNCPAMCDEWAQRDSRIKVIHKQNGGVLAARNTGVEQSSGEYIAFVDSDDWVTQDYIEYLYSILNENDADISGVEFCDVDEGFDEVPTCDIDERLVVYDYENIVKNCVSYLCTKLFKRTLFSDMPDLPHDITVCEDTVVNHFLFKNCKKMVLSNLRKYYYFRHPDSVLCGCITYPMIDDSMRAYDIIFDDIKKSFGEKSDIYKYQIHNKTIWQCFLINSIIRNNACVDRYALLCGEIKNNRKIIFSKKVAKVFTKKQLIGLYLMVYIPFAYKLSIKIRTKIRGW